MEFLCFFRVVNKNGKYHVNESMLVIRKIDESDFGVYHCVASLQHNKDTIEIDSVSNYVLKVDLGANETYLNEITGNGALIKVGENKRLALECRFSNAHSITWRLIERHIHNGTKG